MQGAVQRRNGVFQAGDGRFQALIPVLHLRQGQLGDLPQLIAQLDLFQRPLGAGQRVVFQPIQLKLGGQDGQVERLCPGDRLVSGIVDLPLSVFQGLLVVLLLLFQIIQLIFQRFLCGFQAFSLYSAILSKSF